MVKLTWENKTDINEKIVKLKKKYNKFFEDSIDNLSFGDGKVPSNSNLNSWRNKLFWGENLKVLYSLLNNFEDKIDLIYVDPPFFSGVNYKIEIFEENKVYDSIAYTDSWQKDLDSYLQMLYERVLLFQKLLSKTGLLFIHLDWHASHYIRIILDEIFGVNRFVNNIIWYYYNKYSAGKKNLPRAYDNILVYSKTQNYTFNEIRIPRKKPRKQLMRVNVNGILKNAKDENGHVKYRTVTDKKLDDVWKIPCLQPASKEWTGFPTQKHHALLRRIIELGSNEDDLIADFFCGSGTTLVEAEKLKRRWIGCDRSEYSIYISRKRLLNFHRKHQINYQVDLKTHLDDEKKSIMDTGLFQKDLQIKRKK
jgi:adenine specific DNA methylase Mod